MLRLCAGNVNASAIYVNLIYHGRDSLLNRFIRESAPTPTARKLMEIIFEEALKVRGQEKAESADKTLSQAVFPTAIPQECAVIAYVHVLFGHMGRGSRCMPAAISQ